MKKGVCKYGILTIHLHASNPQIPFMYEIPVPNAPPKAPANVALARIRAILKLLSSGRYQNVLEALLVVHIVIMSTH